MASLENRYPPLFERLFRALGLRGPIGSEVSYAAGTSIDLLDLTKPEYTWLSREFRYMAGIDVSASVGNQSIIGILNASTDRLVVVERAAIFNPGAAVINCGCNTDTASTGATSGRVMGLDTRQDISTTLAPRPTAQPFSNAAAVALPATSPFFRVNVNQYLELASPDIPIVLRPGTAWWVQTGATNTALQALLSWRERQISDSELS